MQALLTLDCPLVMMRPRLDRQRGAVVRKLPCHPLDKTKCLAPKVGRDPSESPTVGGEGDPITISDEFGDGPRLTGARVLYKRVETPQVKGRMPWPILLHSIEEEKKKKKKKNEEEQRKRREDEKKKEEEEEEQQRSGSCRSSRGSSGSSRNSWSSTGSKSCRSFNYRSGSWRSCSSNNNRKGCMNSSRSSRRVSRRERRSCWFVASRLLRGFVLGGLPPSWLSHGGRTVSWYWRSPCAHRRI